jgi:protein-S-isoprenylcysteine O-methyltransferase Ste14
MSARLMRGERDPGGFHPRILPPVWAAIVALLMYVVDVLLERTDVDLLPITGADGAATAAGIVLLVLGTALTVWSAWQFVARDTPLEPGRIPTALVTSGPFRVSRNPMYVGMAITLAGWACWLAQPAALVGPPAFLLIVYLRIVRHEERLLEERFGGSYRDYRARVRRWI